MQNNLLFELIPLFIFFIVYYLTKNIFLSTSICIIMCWTQIALCRLKYKKISRNLWISTILITLFGGLSVILHNKTFIMIKPTVLYWILACFMLVGQIAGKNPIKASLQKEFDLPDSLWNRLNLVWVGFFIAMGALNLFVAFKFSEYTWVKFKVFGMSSLIIVFGIFSVIFIYSTRKKTK